MALDQQYSDYVTHDDPNSEIGQWHLVAFFSQKMILVETYYKIYDQELLAIVEAFKTWRHYLKGYKYEVFVLIDHNNLRQFMDIKSLSFCQVRWAQELSWYTIKSIITRERLMLRLMPCFASHKEVRLRKKHSKMRILKFFIICRPL